MSGKAEIFTPGKSRTDRDRKPPSPRAAWRYPVFPGYILEGPRGGSIPAAGPALTKPRGSESNAKHVKVDVLQSSAECLALIASATPLARRLPRAQEEYSVILSTVR